VDISLNQYEPKFNNTTFFSAEKKYQISMKSFSDFGGDKKCIEMDGWTWQLLYLRSLCASFTKNA